jgi:hypothetical protein
LNNMAELEFKIDIKSAYGAVHRNSQGPERVVVARGTDHQFYQIKAYGSGILAAIRERGDMVPWDLPENRGRRLDGGLVELGIDRDSKDIANIISQAHNRDLIEAIALELTPRGLIKELPDDIGFWTKLARRAPMTYPPIRQERPLVATRFNWTRINRR